ncbi:M50 family metallopeptidase [Fredinandcohnia sp. 179-A 10B2 NHS]|uniref:M50 family metallopeptidase n=1 Tax=Fredinandcohnia sp. 179-A 10B2 NHS TaxID=3235176 RepID=UPI0039A39C62
MRSLTTPKWVSVIGILLATLFVAIEKTQETTLLTVSLIFAAWLAIALHEMGHVVFGKRAGFKFGFFTVGPIQVEKTSSGIKVTENKNWTFFGGVALMLPPEVKKEILIKKWATFAAGGPLTSILITLLSFMFYIIFTYEFLLFFTIMNAGIFIATIVPLKGSMKTDGYVLLSLLNKDKAHKVIDELLIMRELLGKKKPSDWNQEYIKAAKQKEASLENLQYAMLIYYHEIEKHGFQAAVDTMKEYREIPITKKNQFQLGFLIHMQQLSLFLQENPSLKEIVVLQNQLSNIEPFSFTRGKAMIAFLENDEPKANEYIDKVKKMISESEGMYGFFQAEKTLTSLLEKRMKVE